jgi:hypothetical protein
VLGHELSAARRTNDDIPIRRRVCSADCRSVQTMLEAPSTSVLRYSRANRCCSSASPAGFVRRNSALKILKPSSSRGGHLHQSAPLLSRILQHLAPLTDRLLELRGDGALSSAPLCSLIQGVAYHPIEEDPVASPPPISLARRRQEAKRGALAWGSRYIVPLVSGDSEGSSREGKQLLPHPEIPKSRSHRYSG